MNRPVKLVIPKSPWLMPPDLSWSVKLGLFFAGFGFGMLAVSAWIIMRFG